MSWLRSEGPDSESRHVRVSIDVRSGVMFCKKGRVSGGQSRDVS